MLEVLPSLSYRRLTTRSYNDRKRQKSIFSGQIGRSFHARPCHEMVWVKKAVVYFVAYACAFIFPYWQGHVKSRKSEPSLSSVLGVKEPVIGSKTSHEGK